MTQSYRKPTEKNFADFNAISNMIMGEQVNTEGGNKTTDSITGSQQYVATTYTVSDILQGTLNFRDPSESLLVTNLALTNHLRDLYAIGADSLASLSTSSPGQGLVPNSSASGNSDAFDPVTGTVRQEWVETLPATHTNGAILWATKGKGSREMHLPTAENITDDIRQHKQYSDMPPEWRHPWNMDRRGGAVGGEAKIYYDVNDAQSVLGESSQANGQPGAFGFLTPEEEQFYISMAWPYKGDVAERFIKANRPDIAEKAKQLDKSLYKGRRILVFCVQTKKAVVCTPGDWGPHPYYSNGAVARSSINGSYFGLSPDTHHALGSDGKMDFIVGFMPDGTPLGPYTPQNATQGLTSGAGGGGLVSSNTPFNNTAEEMQYAGQLIVNHPNFLLNQGHFNATSVFLTGFPIDPRTTGIVPAKSTANPGRGFLMPSLLNWLWICMEAGFIFGGYLGAYVVKQAKYNQNRISHHAKGGAIDIGRIGHVSYGNGVTFSLSDLSKSRHVMEEFIDFMGTMPSTVLPEEIGGPYATPDGSKVKVYLDPGHIHFGFSENRPGALMPALKVRHVNYSNAGTVTRS